MTFAVLNLSRAFRVDLAPKLLHDIPSAELRDRVTRTVESQTCSSSSQFERLMLCIV